MRSVVRHSIEDGVFSESVLKRQVERKFKVKFDAATFHNVVTRNRSELFPYHCNDMRELFQWLLLQKKEAEAATEFDLSDDGKVRRVFYMSADMRHNFIRNGEVIVMDTTMKTNRFDMPLTILVGVNQHNHTIILAVALTSEQDTDSFSWILRQIDKHIGYYNMVNVRTVFTDGDLGMIRAVERYCPRAKMVRCWFHLKLNLRHNLSKYFDTVAEFNYFISQWTQACLSATVTLFEAEKERLHAAFPKTVHYLTKNIWKNEQSFANCYVRNTVTWGMYSTQRVESFNAKLKTMCQRGANTDVKTLFERLLFAAEESEQKEIKIYEQSCNVLPLEPMKGDAFVWLRTIFTVYAVNLIHLEHNKIHNVHVTSLNNTNTYKCECFTKTFTIYYHCRHYVMLM